MTGTQYWLHNIWIHYQWRSLRHSA